MSDRFILPVIGNVPKDQDATIRIKTRGLLSSVGGASLIIDLVGVDKVDVGTLLIPIIFECKVKELESIRSLLEDTLQKKGFDRDLSALVIVEPSRMSHELDGHSMLNAWK